MVVLLALILLATLAAVALRRRPRGGATLLGSAEGRERPVEARAGERAEAQARRDRTIERHRRRMRQMLQERGRRLDTQGVPLDDIVETAMRIFPEPAPRTASDTASARLSPAVTPGGRLAGFFGGAPELPDGIAYPVDRHGDEMGFIAQIDCSALPDLLWSGVGPRTGYLRFFFPLRWRGGEPWPYVLHTQERGARRPGPSLGRAEWFRSPMGHRIASARSETPRWPLVIEALPGDADPMSEYRLGHHPLAPDPRDISQFDLSRPDYRPWAVPVLDNVLRVAHGALALRREALDNRFSRSVPETPASVTYRRLLDRTLEELRALREEVASGACDLNTGFARFAAIEVPELVWIEDETGGARRQALGPAYGAADPPVHVYSGRYTLRDALFDIERFAFVEGPGVLPAPVRERLEREFTFFAAYERFGMGHIPKTRYTSAPIGDDRYEVLLEVPSSKLAGWCFGDVDRICYLIPREDLKAGDFSRVMLDVSSD